MKGNKVCEKAGREIQCAECHYGIQRACLEVLLSSPHN